MMRPLRRFFLRLRNQLRMKGASSESDAELECHLAHHIDDNLRAGMTPEEARRQALIQLGGMEQTRQTMRERSTLPWLDSLLRDVRYALRGFRRSPVFAVTAILTLALGIGATTTVFSVVDRILFRPLPYAHADRIVSVGMVHSLEKEEFMMGGFFFDWRDHQKPFEFMATQGTMPYPCDLIESNPAELDCLTIGAKFLPLFGVTPMLGRNFTHDEDSPNGPNVVIISYDLWQGHYSGDPGIIDRTINVDGVESRVVGVLPKGFQFPTLQAAQILFPSSLNRAIQNKVNGGYGNPMRTFARLKPGVSVAQARAEMQPLFTHTLNTFVPSNIRQDVHLSIRSLRDRETQNVQIPAWILLGSVLALLLIACANVAGLLMVRRETRERELAVRSALGASRMRLIQQSLVESVLLSLCAAAMGIALAAGFLKVILRLAPTGIPFLTRASLDLRIAVVAVLLSLLCRALFGLLSSLRTTRAISLAARVAKFRNRALLRRGLVVGQISICIVLLAGAALLLRSFQNVVKQNLGMNSGGVVSVRVALPWFRYNTSQKKMDFYLQAESAIRRLPGIEAVGISDSVPPGGWAGGFRWAGLKVEGKPIPKEDFSLTGVHRTVTPDYFRALQIPIIRGRVFTKEDRSSTQSFIIMDKFMADRLFPGENPIGKHIQEIGGSKSATIVGVAANVKNGGLTSQSVSEIYTLRRNVAADYWEGRLPLFIIRSALSTGTTISWVRSQISKIDPTVPITAATLNEQINNGSDRPRFEAALLGFFALVGLALAAIGLYGVLAFIAAQRTQEIGIRMALGASRTNILRLIASEGARLIVIGSALGIVTAIFATRLLKSMLYHVKADDPLTFAAVVAVLAVVALAATLAPARRAMKTDPMEALRTE